MTEDAGRKRAEWLEDKIPDIYMDEVFDEYRKHYAKTTHDATTPTTDDIKKLMEKETSHANSKIGRGGSGQ